jgi:hypothetical protein
LKKIFYCFLFLLLANYSIAQKIQILTDSIHLSFRGLSVVDKKVIWVSGNKGTVGKSEDGGKSWKWMIVKGFEKTDFRDIEAFDKTTAVIMSVGEPAYILRTTDGGNSWKIVFEDHSKGMFLDAMEFWNEQSGIVIGDPIDDLFFIARTFDGGKTWQNIPGKYRPVADSAEACFASSGTNIRKLNKGEAVFVSGGQAAHLFIRDKKIKIPLIQGKQTTGANSIAVKNDKTMVIVGGDFSNKDDTEKNCVITFDGGKTFSAPQVSPSGYRSCVEYLYKNTWLTCGLNGVDISTDNGMTWKNISKESFHVCRKSKKGKVVFLAGNDGKIAKLIP